MSAYIAKLNLHAVLHRRGWVDCHILLQYVCMVMHATIVLLRLLLDGVEMEEKEKEGMEQEEREER